MFQFAVVDATAAAPPLAFLIFVHLRDLEGSFCFLLLDIVYFNVSVTSVSSVRVCFFLGSVCTFS